MTFPASLFNTSSLGPAAERKNAVSCASAHNDLEPNARRGGDALKFSRLLTYFALLVAEAAILILCDEFINDAALDYSVGQPVHCKHGKP